MVDLLGLANLSEHSLSNPLPRMNPFGLRSAHVLGACSERTRHNKTPRIPDRSAVIQPYRSNSTHDCGDIFGYAKFMQIVRGVHACAMQYEFLFIFQKDIRAAIE
jgi:hypothetical protein